MRQETRFKFNAYLSRVAELNGIDAGDVSKKFTVEPSVTQTLMNTMQESSDFLTRINIVPVSEMKGEKIGIGVTGSIASTTDTAGGTERQPKDFSKLASTSTNATRLTSIFISATKRLTCGRVIRISSSVSVTPLSNASPLISSWPVLTA
ncbi:phage major capsid, P2 family protein [Escherichia coli p0305293.13]|nr:P2 family phage major capsid protein [Escherichia coli]END26446.1 phage major capsid, P2 family protein [Escherichia coli p0305293.13]